MSDPTICEICSRLPARLILLRRRRNLEHRTYVCNRCALERSRLYLGSSVSLRLAEPDDHVAALDSVSRDVCEVCGLRYSGGTQGFHPGCCACYVNFEGLVEAEIRKAQGHCRHVGKAPVE